MFRFLGFDVTAASLNAAVTSVGQQLLVYGNQIFIEVRAW